MHRVATKFVSRLVTEEQKEQLVAISQVDQANSDENCLKTL
jgi:hypothetical protein